MTLDGAPLAAARPCTFLGFGYDNGYRETDPVRLEAGEHVFTCAGREDRGLFLPVLWMEGMFAVADGPSVLRQLRTARQSASTGLSDLPLDGPPTLLPLPEQVPCGPLSAIGLGDFAGKATYRMDIDIPADAEAVELGTGHAAASVRIGGHDAGTRLFAPWRYAIPAELRGTRQSLEITVTTSVRPMFGAESDDVPGALPSQKPGWVKTIPEEPDTGLVSVRILRGPAI